MHLTTLLNISLPLIQAPMAGVQNSALALEVCRAGGLGSVPCAMLSPEALRSELEIMRDSAAGPWNVNFFCHTSPQQDEQREAAWRHSLAPYYEELGLDVNDIKAGGGRRPFDAESLEILREFRPPVVSFHFGLPTPELLSQVKSWGAKVMSSATTVAEARWLEAKGADVIIAQGLEAGGHRGMFLTDDISTQIGTFALLPQIAKAVRLPVVAAGGIADATGVAAALALGAAGVQIGTAYLLCPESTTSAVHRAALQSDAVEHTVLTNVFSGRPARGMVNRIIREIGPFSSDAPAFPLAGTAVTPLRSAAEKQGTGDFSPLWSGQNARGCKTIPAYELTLELARPMRSPGTDSGYIRPAIG
ncbi:MAG TPA: nitronate monooxygenase [Pseudomonas xinjiangensis]|uniref:Nitronate monooxygenase n=2 Tax=root TaxID=1 RepID=A0A7V1BRU9_9GAMM|nr:nitronate monooxygenase [Halopseudomonas xinjiangensis]HEC47264.1 nitronate monooxygenase [Halopseudomonas xinjiangensis]